MHHSSDKHNRRGSFLPNLIIYALLAIIVASGAWLRFAHDNWDGGNQLHPDERGILFVAQDIEMPASLSNALNPSYSSLNPFRTPQGIERNYPYGHLPLYMTVIARRVLGGVCLAIGPVCEGVSADSWGGRLLNVSGLPRFDHLMTVSRALSALFDTLTIVAVYLLARELFPGKPRNTPAGAGIGDALLRDSGVGLRPTPTQPIHGAALVATGLCSAAVLHIQNAHFGTVDTALALFATLCVWLLSRASRTQQGSDAMLAGVCAGLALGCKASALALVFPIGAAYGGRKGRPSAPRQLWLTFGAAIVTFALTNPYVLLDPAPFLSSLAAQAAMASGALDWPFTRQYLGTLPIGYAIEQQARWGLGPPLVLAGYGGWVWAAWRAWTERSRALAIAVVWASAVLVLGSVTLVKFPRYLLPLTPTLSAFAGAILTIPWAAGGIEHCAVGWLRRACLGMVMVTTTLYALAIEGIYRQPHPWVSASEWVYRELPAGTAIAVEQGDDALPLDITMGGQLYLASEHVDACAIDPFAEPDDEAKLARTLKCLARADFLFLSSNRHYGVIPRLSGRYPLMAATYRALFAGDLGFGLERSFRRPPTLLGWSLVDDPFALPGLPNPLGGWGDRAINLGPADESLVVYDHPLVLVFGNKERLSVEEMRGRLEVGLEPRNSGIADGAEEQAH